MTRLRLFPLYLCLLLLGAMPACATKSPLLPDGPLTYANSQDFYDAMYRDDKLKYEKIAEELSKQSKTNKILYSNTLPFIKSKTYLKGRIDIYYAFAILRDHYKGASETEQEDPSLDWNQLQENSQSVWGDMRSMGFDNKDSLYDPAKNCPRDVYRQFVLSCVDRDGINSLSFNLHFEKLFDDKKEWADLLQSNKHRMTRPVRQIYRDERWDKLVKQAQSRSDPL